MGRLFWVSLEGLPNFRREEFLDSRFQTLALFTKTFIFLNKSDAGGSPFSWQKLLYCTINYLITAVPILANDQYFIRYLTHWPCQV